MFMPKRRLNGDDDFPVSGVVIIQLDLKRAANLAVEDKLLL